MINSPSVLTALAPPSQGAAPGGTWPRVPRRGLKRPRGLWKARRRLDPVTTAATSSLAQHQLLQAPGGGAKSSSSGRGSDTDREMESCGDGEGEEDEDDDGDDMSQNSNSSKRQRRDSGGGSSTTSNNNNNNMNKDYSNSIPMELWAVYVDSEPDVGGAMDTHDRMAPSCGTGAHGTPPEENNDIATARRVAPLISKMATTSIAERAPSGATKETYEYSDWEEIKEMLTWASELCDRDDPAGSVPFLRAVIHECHRFLVRFPDPSVFFSRPAAQGQRRERSTSPDAVPVSEERPWAEPVSRRSSTPEYDMSPTQQFHRHHHHHHHHHHPVDSPTALHAMLGVALFLFGNVIAQNPSLALPREPTTPSPYWLAALDVLNAGDSLPCLTDGTYAYSSSSSYDAAGGVSASADDWRVAIAWGRTLVALAYEATKRASSPSPPPSPATARAWLPSAPASPHSPTPSPTSSSPPRYQPRSPLAAIATLRTPGLIHAARATAPELLTLAADQFSRGIFHMPHNNPQPHRYFHHPNSSTHTLSPSRSTTPSCVSPSSGAAAAAAAPQRPHVLFTLASEVLAVAERLGHAEARKRWAKWADEVFLQMHMEADVDAWRARVGVARGRCWLAIGSVRADEMEDALGRGDGSVLLSKEAEDARASLSTSISFFDRAENSASTESSEPSLVNMRPWFAEALLSLANLTADEGAREALYARAQVKGDDVVARELGSKATRTPRSRPRNVDVLMDES